jgi:hypothetical protein
MSVYVEYELRCDVGMPNDRYACNEIVYAFSAAEARRIARGRGWSCRTKGGVKDFCPDHRSEGTE